MLKLSKRVEYALVALVHMGELPADQVTTARAIAARYELPPEILGKVCQALVKAGLVASTQGVKGGYCIGRDLADISLGDVVEAVEGPVHVVPCADPNTTCRHEECCNIQQPVMQFQQRLLGFLYSISLAALVSDAAEPQTQEGPTHLWQPKNDKTRLPAISPKRS